MGIEYDLGQAFAENAFCKVPAATVAQLEELVNTGSMIKWGRIESEISDKKDDVEAVARMIIEKWEMKRNGS